MRKNRLDSRSGYETAERIFVLFTAHIDLALGISNSSITRMFSPVASN